MMRTFRSMARSERAQTLVEFSFAAVIFVIIVIAMVDIGRGVWNYNTLAAATREGARYAIVHGELSSDPSGPGGDHYTEPDYDEKVAERVTAHASGLSPDRLDVTAEWIDGSNGMGDRVRVTSKYEYTPVFTGFFGGGVTLRSSSTMRINY
jgi:Flp pilus assembly protein TadG